MPLVVLFRNTYIDVVVINFYDIYFFIGDFCGSLW
ncbi:Uncharacterised protein [Chlamydia trachomatis]|nr:Uncharacterised protein [Chlamydia trachomatis]